MKNTYHGIEALRMVSFSMAKTKKQREKQREIFPKKKKKKNKRKKEGPASGYPSNMVALEKGNLF